MWSRKFLIYPIHCSKRRAHFWFRGEKRAFLTSILCYRVNSQLQMIFLLLCSPIRHSIFLCGLLQKSKCLNWWRVLISLRHMTIMGLVIRLLSYAVRVFMFILLLVLICIIQLAITRTNESLQFIYLKMTTVSSKWDRPVSLLVSFSNRSVSNNYLLVTDFPVHMIYGGSLKIILHGTTLWHTASLQQTYTTWIVSCKSDLQLAYDCRVGPKSFRRPGVSLLYATKSYRVKRPLEGGKEVRVVVLDINKAFDKVWHAALLCKLEALGVQWPLL